MRIPDVHSFKRDRADKKIKHDYDIIEVSLKPSEYVDDLSKFESDEELHKFVVRTKYYIRRSLEYASLMKFLKKKAGMYRCGIHTNITSWDKFPIHIHHTPLVIEDLIYIVINKRIICKDSLKQADIASEVMMLHYLGLVGLYPLCETCHEYAHSDKSDLFIPLSHTIGDVSAFFHVYDEYISQGMKDKFKTIQYLNTTYEAMDSTIPESLRRKYLYVDTDKDTMVSVSKLHAFLKG